MGKYSSPSQGDTVEVELKKNHWTSGIVVHKLHSDLGSRWLIKLNNGQMALCNYAQCIRKK